MPSPFPPVRALRLPLPARQPSSSQPSTGGRAPWPSLSGIHVPRSRQITAAEDTDEVALAHDVVLLAARAPPEYHLVAEAGGPPKLNIVQSTSDCRPGADVRAISGGLVADLAHSPPACLACEADLTCTQNHVSVGTGHVLTSPRRQPKHTVHTDHEGERLGQLRRRSPSDPAAEVSRRADPTPAATRPDRSLQLDRSDISVTPPPRTHVSQPRALPTRALELGLRRDLEEDVRASPADGLRRPRPRQQRRAGRCSAAARQRGQQHRRRPHHHGPTRPGQLPEKSRRGRQTLIRTDSGCGTHEFVAWLARRGRWLSRYGRRLNPLQGIWLPKGEMAPPLGPERVETWPGHPLVPRLFPLLQ